MNGLRAEFAAARELAERYRVPGRERALALALKARARLSAAVALDWRVRCVYDTDSDGDCHLCFLKGGCENFTGGPCQP